MPISECQNDEYTNETIAYLEKTNIKKRKSLGQYFTPKTLREKLLDQLVSLWKKDGRSVNDKASILDPACGTGEFLLTAKKYFPKARVYAIDIDKKLVGISRSQADFAEIKTADALKENFKTKFDFIVGNPPYFEMKLDNEMKKKYECVVKGRANIFALFIKLSLDIVKDEGYVAFVLPTSMNNGLYFSKLRKYIMTHASVEYISIEDETDIFHKASQKVMILILKKTKHKNMKYIFHKNDITIFTENKKYLSNIYKTSLCLFDMGYSVKTGGIIWNEHKENLTNENKNTIPVIYSTNIKDGSIILDGKNEKRKQYIKRSAVKNILTGKSVVVSRITGSGKDIRINSAVANMKEYLCENHVNVVYKIDNASKYTEEYIQKCLENEHAKKTLMLITGNTQVSSKELLYLLPIAKK